LRHEQHFWPLHRGNLLDFLWQLHVQLALGHVGGLVLGIVALVWLVDCFVGVYLTLPARAGPSAVGATHPAWTARWWPAWKLKWPASPFRLNFDLHRAGGLWTWAFLFMFAWSSGTFNLPAVFHPVNDFLFGPRPIWTAAATLQAQAVSPVDLRTAHAIARRLMAEQARLHGFVVRRERQLVYVPQGGYHNYGVDGDALFGGQDTTFIRFDAVRQQVLDLYMPSGLHASVTLVNWLSGLHTAAIWGWPYKAVVCLMGLVISLLSVTGVYLWWKKRQAREIAIRLERESEAMAALGNVTQVRLPQLFTRDREP
jgi:uncharacterized iron-regulated membrane protein